MSTFAEYPEGFECQVCLEQQERPFAHEINDDPICEDCIQDNIVPMFKEAIEHEFNWPPKYGATTLDIDDFERYLGSEFATRYRRKEIEYKAPIANRTYCECKIRADHKLPAGATRSTDITLSDKDVEMCNRLGVPIVDCGNCVATTPQKAGVKLCCDSCGGETICTGETKTVTDLEKEGLGESFQVCSSCQLRFYRYDGCNQINCKCGASVCFICGELVTSGHFARGQCPRFGNKGSERAIFDEDRHAHAVPGLRREEADVGFALVDMLMGFVVVDDPIGLAAQALEHRETEEERAMADEIEAFSRTVFGQVNGLDLMLRLAEIPFVLRTQRALMRTLDRGLLDGHHMPRDHLEQAFVVEHLDLVTTVARVGPERLSSRLPLIDRAYQQYFHDLRLPTGMQVLWRNWLVEARRNARA